MTGAVTLERDSDIFVPFRIQWYPDELKKMDAAMGRERLVACLGQTFSPSKVARILQNLETGIPVTEQNQPLADGERR
jgi:hypothetical protein